MVYRLAESKAHVPFKPDQLHFKFYVIDKFEGDKTAILFVSHHGFADGFGTIYML